MVKIMRCIIGKDFGNPDFKVKFDSPYYPGIFGITFTEVEVPFPLHSFDQREVRAFRDFLTNILDEHDRISTALEEINV